MTELTALTRVLAIEVDGDARQLADRLKAKGISVTENGRTLLVQKDDDSLLDVVRDAVVDLDLGLVRLEQSRRRLEELFEPPSDPEDRDGARV